MKLGTRGSRLAQWQAEWVRGQLAALGVAAELVVIKTRGDAEVDRPLHELEGKGFFTKEIEEALLERVARGGADRGHASAGKSAGP